MKLDSQLDLVDLAKEERRSLPWLVEINYSGQTFFDGYVQVLFIGNTLCKLVFVGW